MIEEAKKWAQLNILTKMIEANSDGRVYRDALEADFYESLSRDTDGLQEIEEDADIFSINLNSNGGELLASCFDGGEMQSKVASEMPTGFVAGARVVFHASLDTVLSYREAPAHLEGGTVVAVKTSMGSRTQHNGKVFVKWDSGALADVFPRHLEIVGQDERGAFRRTASTLGDLTSFFKGARTENNAMVQLATNDLWAYKKVGDRYVLERLFKEDGSPLKE